MNGLSESFVYGAKPRAISAGKTRVNITPLGGREYKPGDTVSFAFPCGDKGTFYNARQSYLKFKIQNKDEANAMTLDYSAHSIFRLLEVVYSSNVLEYVDQYASLVTMLEDSQGDTLQASWGGSVAEGRDTTTRTGATIPAGGEITVCLPILSGVLGSTQQKFIPIGDMVRNHLRLNMTLSSKADAQISADSGSGENLVEGVARDWVITDVEFVAEIIRVDRTIAATISERNARGYVIPITTFSNHASSVEAGSTLINTLISGNYRSLKTIFSIFRLQDNFGKPNRKFISTRTNPFGNSGRWHYDVSGLLTPAKPVDTNAEAFAELQKALHAYGSLDHHGQIRITTWTADEGTYIVGQDLETQSHKSMVSESGVDVSTSTIYLKAQFAAALAKALRIDTWTHQDGFIYIDPTGMVESKF